MKNTLKIFSLLLLMSACSTKENAKLNSPKSVEKSNPKVATNERTSNPDQIKFVLFKSDYDPKETYLKMKEYLEGQGMYHPRLVDHQTAAANVDIQLKPVYLVIFGNPKTGSLLIKENPEVAIELPLKALIYQDDEGQTWVMYKDMNYLKALYSLKDSDKVIPRMNKLMEGFKKAVYNPIKTTEIKEEDLN